MSINYSIEAIKWTTFNGFMSDDGEVLYQEGHTTRTVARVTVDGREVVSPTSDLNAAYRNFNSRLVVEMDQRREAEQGVTVVVA